MLQRARLGALDAALPAWARGLMRDSLQRIGLIGAQTAEDAQRFGRLGAREGSVQVPGNLKFDFPLPADVEARGATLRALHAPHRPLWVAGSTHPGEEGQVHRRAARAAAPRLRSRGCRTTAGHGAATPGALRPVSRNGSRRRACEASDVRHWPMPRRSRRISRCCCWIRWANCSAGMRPVTSPSSAAASCRSVGTTCWSRRHWPGPFWPVPTASIHPRLPCCWSRPRRWSRVNGCGFACRATLAELLEDPPRARALGARAALAVEANRGAAMRSLAALERLMPISAEVR